MTWRVDPVAEAVAIGQAIEARTQAAADADRLNPTGAHYEAHPHDAEYPGQYQAMPRNYFTPDAQGGGDHARAIHRTGSPMVSEWLDCPGCGRLGLYHRRADAKPDDQRCERCKP